MTIKQVNNDSAVIPTELATKQKIDQLAKRLEEAADAYYNSGNTIMSDIMFDQLKEKLRRIDNTHPFLIKVGAPPITHLEKVNLLTHMGSLNHAMQDIEFWKWYDKYENPEVVVTDKVDGCSVEVVYHNGALIRVSSRGDGKVGNNITANAKKWKDLPHKIFTSTEDIVRDQIVIRGEAIILKEIWEKYFPGEQNPRNSTSGTIMRKSGDRNEHITFIAFGIDFQINEIEKFTFLERLGFRTPKHILCKGNNYLKEVRDWYLKNRDNLDYEIDGIVVTINDLKVQKEIGYSDGGRRPRGSMAWKFPAETKTTAIIGIQLTQGHTGAIIPTAQLAPVRLMGTTVRNALLNNFDHLEELNVNIGDIVEIFKAGDIIPKINRVVKKNSIGPFTRPVKCPICKTDLKIDGRYLKCVNDFCQGRSFQRVKNWIKKTGIKQLGDRLLEVLMETKNPLGFPLVRKIYDLYTLTPEIIKDLLVGNGILGEKLALRVIAEIDKTRVLPVEIFMGSLGIKYLGRRQAKHLEFKTPEDYINASKEELSSKENMGDNKAEEMAESIKKKADEIIELLSVIQIKGEEKVVSKFEKLTGKSVVFTGKIESFDPEGKRYTRKYLQKLVQEHGGLTPNSISKDVDYLVVADPSTTSSKAVKARRFGINIIDEKQFFKLLRAPESVKNRTSLSKKSSDVEMLEDIANRFTRLDLD